MHPVPTTTATTTAPLLLTEVSKRYGDRTVLDRVTLTVRPGERIGVVGDNGSGKSTLLRLLAGREQPDNGTVLVTAPGGTGYLPQEPGLPATALVGDAIDLALAELRTMERRIREAESALRHAGPAELAAYGDLVTAYEARGGRDADRQVEIVLRRLGERVAPDRSRPLATLSGGQRSRLALAATLAGSPELLLLDEPTNDLDDEAVDWLEQHLLAHRGTVVAVTHDRAFLDRVTTTVLEVDEAQHTVARYGNGYQGFLTAKAAARARRHRQYAEWREDLARHSALAESNIGLLSAIPRKAPAAFSGAGAFRARSRAHGAMSRIRNAREQVHRLTENPVPPPPEPLRFTGSIRSLTAGGTELTGVRVPGRLTLDALRIEPGGRLLVTGPNGAGKSTLLQVLAGELVPERGTVRRPDGIGFLRQNTALPDDDRTVLAAFAAARHHSDPEEAAAELLPLGLFRTSDLATPVRALSTGQRRRLELAVLVSAPAGLLLLDEPTNHLAPALVEEIEAALAQYTGTLVVVTHDRRMRAAFEGGTGSRLEL
ncbi:ribosomal protection-like ABC-F family protein [Streptomyces sp. NPDC057136]|uniref:ribosomal protection-like ABC-F family protein n=1 Tax=Streptomyces sp. NPDC057136 TaxID=3346029 RepID=UPI003644178A